MATTQAKSGKSVQFKMSATLIADILSVSGPGLSQETLDATHSESTDNAVEKIVDGFVDAGEVTLELHFVPGDTGQQALIDQMYAGTATAFSIVWPQFASKTWTFQAFVTGFNPDTPVRDKMVCEFTFSITGKPDFDGA